MSDSVALSPGARIDSLRIDRVLGQGASGITYLVTDTVLDTSFALKEYLPRALVNRGPGGRLAAIDDRAQAAFQQGLGAFLAEGRTMAKLEHPNLARVFRCFEANGTAYLQMSWYQGEALHRLLERGGALDREETLTLLHPMLDALEYLHARGVVHRDVKPANIYILQDGTPVLIDFGTAALPVGAAHGSAGYAAPEQSDPAATPGPAADLYGLAATLYRCVVGRIPAAADERGAAIRAGAADPLQPLATLLPERDFGGLLRAIESGLALDPSSRPASVAAWRRQFDSPPGAPLHAPDDEREGREWLPLILLTIFGAALLTVVIYLFLPGPDTAPGGITPSQDATQQRSPQEEGRWHAALEADTAFGYQQFMADYPESIHNDQAVLHLERLDHQAWGEALQEGGRAAIEAYLERFPNGLHRAGADIRLEEIRLAEQAEQRRLEEDARQDDAAWDGARAARTDAALEAYLADWPGGRHEAEARELLENLRGEAADRRAFEAAAKLDSIEAWTSYMTAFPQGSQVAAALEAIDRLTLRPGKSFRDCPDCPTMMVVPAGSFWQGSEAANPLALKKETPPRLVTFAEPFAIGVFEVTFQQWDRCVADGGCGKRPGDNGWGRGSRPVIMVSWNDAQEYAAWLSQLTGQRYSLPSESQWEYAARAGREGDWLGGDPALVCQFGNIAGAETGFRWRHEDCSDPSALATLPVGSLRANAFGLHDLVGNVAEWTLDCMNLSYLDAPADGSAWSRGICSSRMTRGGSWFTGSREIRLPARFNLKNGDRNDFTGFRVVRTVED